MHGSPVPFVLFLMLVVAVIAYPIVLFWPWD